MKGLFAEWNERAGPLIFVILPKICEAQWPGGRVSGGVPHDRAFGIWPRIVPTGTLPHRRRSVADVSEVFMPSLRFSGN